MADKISVIEFVTETKEDVNSPTTSTFASKMTLCRATIAALEESLDADRSALKKMKSAIKAMHNSGQGHVKNQSAYFEQLDMLGMHVRDKKESQPDIASAFLKMAKFAKELSELFKNVVGSINKHLLFPMESLLKGDLKGIKGDMKRPFDKSWKDYDGKVKQVEREKRQLAKDAGMIRSEITGAEIAEEMKKERRMFQLQMCEYLIKANEVKTKKGVDFLQHLVEFYHDQNLFFSEGVKVIESYRTWSEQLTAKLQSLRQSQDDEKRQLVELRTVLKSVCDTENNTGKAPANVYNLHQMQGNKALGTEKAGFLMKRSEGLRKAWQKRRCFVAEGILTISHNRTNKDPVRLNLLTCQLKLVPEDKKQFDLVSHNRTYRFMAEDEHDAMNWISVLSNSKDDALNRVFGDASSGKNGGEQSTGLKELTLSIIDEVRRLPGNNICCDCDATDPTWLSTNLGVLLCIECSGIHRDMGVHVSRIQSLTLDDLGTSELLLAYSIGNDAFNNIMEEKLNTALKPTSSSDMEERKSFIRGKYISRNYVVQTCAGDADALADELGQAIRSCDLAALLQLYGEKVDLSVSLPGYEDEETALHVAVSLPTGEDLVSILPLVDFLCQNVGTSLNKKTLSGNTALHFCAENNKTESMKLLLRSKAKTDIENMNGETPLAIARRMNHHVCQELLEQANSGKFRSIVHIDTMWNLTCVDEDEFASDDDLDERISQSFLSPSKMNNPENARNRPSSFKDRPKPAIELPHPQSRNPPAVPPHQSRSRSQTAAPCPAEVSRPTPLLPPTVPTKPDSLLKGRHVATGSVAGLVKNNAGESKTTSAGEPPIKAASSQHKKSTISPSMKYRLLDDIAKPHAAHYKNELSAHVRSGSDSFVSPRRILKSTPSFAKKQSLTTRLNRNNSSTSSLLDKSHSFNANDVARNLSPLTSRSENDVADASETQSASVTEASRYRPRAGLVHGRTEHFDFQSDHWTNARFAQNDLSSNILNKRPASSYGNANIGLNQQPSLNANQQAVMDEKARSLPRNTSLTPAERPAPPPGRTTQSMAKPTSTTAPARPRRVQAIYDCEADNQDELTFVENEVIVVTGVEDQEWWIGHIEHQPHRNGVFPVSFVHILTD